MKDVVIVGGGAGGLMCAVKIKNRKVTILEKADKVGKKILATGNGCCNLTNINAKKEKYNSDLVAPFFDVYGVKNAINDFEKFGLEVYQDSEGRVYPISNSANSVLDVLRLQLKQNGTEEICNTLVKAVKQNADKTFEITYNDNQKINCKTVVFACGGNACQSLVQNLGIVFKPFSKSLVSLKTDSNKTLMGVRVDNVRVSTQTKNFKFSEIGEILFKENGISGIVIFNLSSYMARVNDYKAVIKLDFMPNKSCVEIQEMLKNRKEIFNQFETQDFLTGLFHKQINLVILKNAEIDLNKKVSELTSAEIQKMAKIIKGYEIKSYEPLNNEQVYSGGVSLLSLSNLLESKQTKGLYFLGEMCDIDGECGGYNLQWAWTSANIVASSINERGNEWN